MRRIAFSLIVAVIVLASGCVTEPPAGSGGGEGPPTNGSGPTPPTGGNGENETTLLFDEDGALASAREQVLKPDGSVRYRVPGSEGNDAAASIIARDLRAAGLDVSYHHFNATYGCEETPMHNVVGVLPGASNRTVYLAAHYDTRPIAEKDPDPERRDEPIQGAIDGAGAVGVLLELARALGPRAPLDATIVFLFFDGEDGGNYMGTQDGQKCTEWILGSRAYAANMTAEDIERADAFVLLDLIGHADARFPQEGYSINGPGTQLSFAVWDTAIGLGYERFEKEPGLFIVDDHVPFVEHEIPAIDVIDLREGNQPFASYHHTHEDNVDALDAGVMGEVGRTVETWVLGTYGGAS